MPMVYHFQMSIQSMWDRNDRPDKMYRCYRTPIRIAWDLVHTFRCIDRTATLYICVKWFERHFRPRVVIGIDRPANDFH